ncbi:Golgi integral membrane protein 4-like, partial [Geospiza fortis]|uniref:Golgi integral membrane protein 4-like n=1 Tax=Geospiza fortis TaxID=48883 RepID=A0A8N5I2N1_GEOFO
PGRRRGLLQSALCLLALACLASGALLYSHLQNKVRSAEALAQKYKQQQEALSAQLQVVYEHRSRLERSLQKERGEHKKTKEDFLVYKLEAQEALNKEKQDSMNRYGALSSQHKILKNQHDDVKKQLLDLQLQHNGLRLEHRKSLESHSQKLAQLQQEKDSEVTNLQDTVFKLREESKLLRKAHLEVHSQLLNAQAQMEEFRQLKEALQKMPGLRGGGGGGGKGQQPPVPASSQLQPGRNKVWNSLEFPYAGVIDRELQSQKETVVQEPMMPDDAADPAQDPNNQGEDEFEEAELERPDFEEKVGGSEKFKEPRVKEEWKEKPPKDAGRAAKPREDPLEDYQEDQEQEIEDHGGEVDDNDDLELVQEQKEPVGRQGAAGKKDDYF